MEQLEGFCYQVRVGLEPLTFDERQQLLRLVVENIIVTDGRVIVDTVTPTEQNGKFCNARGELV